MGKKDTESPKSGSTTQLPWWNRFLPSSRSLCAWSCCWGHRSDGMTPAISGVRTMTGGEGRPWSRRLTNSMTEASSRPSDRCESLHIGEDVLCPRRKGTWPFYRGLGRRLCSPFSRPDKEIFLIFSLMLWIRAENYDFLQLRIPQLMKKCN